MRINNNIQALNTFNQYTQSVNKVSNSMEKLSSGSRINRAGDDAAGLAISEKMRAQIRGLNMASKNAQDGASLIQVAEGAMQETHNVLQRMRELAVQSANDTNNNSVDREALDLEFKQLSEEINDMSSKTKFNNRQLIDGSFSGMNLQVGANAGDTMTISIGEISVSALGLTGTSLASGASAIDALSKIDAAVNKVSTERAKLGAIQNRLDSKIANLNTSSENLTAAESRIRDVDMAKEMGTYSKSNVLLQAGLSMLAQANNAPQNVLSLLR